MDHISDRISTMCGIGLLFLAFLYYFFVIAFLGGGLSQAGAIIPMSGKTVSESLE